LFSIHALDSPICRFTHSLAYTYLTTIYRSPGLYLFDLHLPDHHLQVTRPLFI
jgi:hypothetical protein